MPTPKTDSNCLFCRLAGGQAREFFVHADAEAVVFPVLHPRAEGHLIVVPRAHYRNAFDLPEALAGRLLTVGGRMGQLLRAELGCPGILLAMNCEPPGQDIMHAHLHIIPRYPDDDLDLAKPPEADRAALRTLAARLRNALCPPK